MSSIVRALILRKLHDMECVENALKELGFKAELKQSIFILNNELSLEVGPDGSVFRYNSTNSEAEVQVNKIIPELTRLYDRFLSEKIERLRKEEAVMQEKKALENFSKQDAEEELRLKKERMKAEASRRIEQEEMKRMIQEKAEAIRNKAEKMGYSITEAFNGKERVMVLVRR